MESKIDSLTDQIANITLMVKKCSSLAWKEKKKCTLKDSEYDIVCSYCKELRHIAGGCENNLNKDRLCEQCGKERHVLKDCWSIRLDMRSSLEKEKGKKEKDK